MNNCPCGSGLSLAECCGRYLSGERAAPTAEALMRSRYSAYVLGDIDYVSNTLHPNHRADHDVAAAKRWSRESDWRGLEVRECQAGGEQDEHGLVEFIVRYRDKGIHRVLHEQGRFKREDGRWFYTDGDLVLPETQENHIARVGRNDPCPCGSGKKFKKCCGS